MDEELLKKFDRIEEGGPGTTTDDGDRFVDLLMANPPTVEEYKYLVDKYWNSLNYTMPAVLAFMIADVQMEEADPQLSNLVWRLIEGLEPHWGDPEVVTNCLNAVNGQASDCPWAPLEHRPPCVFPFLMSCLTSDDDHLADTARDTFWWLKNAAPDHRGLVTLFTLEEREAVRDAVVALGRGKKDKPLLEALGF